MLNLVSDSTGPSSAQKRQDLIDANQAKIQGLKAQLQGQPGDRKAIRTMALHRAVVAAMRGKRQFIR
jgi:hypothetical protein